MLIDGKPVLFDAIEFSPLIAAGDVLYDLAFLLMDLTERGQSRPPISCSIATCADRRPEDFDGLAALPLFLSLRAAIRAKVTAARLAQAQPERSPPHRARARAVLRLGARFIAPARPVLVAVGGLSGTGKSALARALAPELAPRAGRGGAALRCRTQGAASARTSTKRCPAQAYAPQTTAHVYASTLDQARRAIAAGHAAFVDAVFAQHGERSVVRSIRRRAGRRSSTGFFLDADIGERLGRIGARGPRCLRRRRGDRAAAGKSTTSTNCDWQRVDASGTPEETLERRCAPSANDAIPGAVQR